LNILTVTPYAYTLSLGTIELQVGFKNPRKIAFTKYALANFTPLPGVISGSAAVVAKQVTS
jgi:hypothetical protein